MTVTTQPTRTHTPAPALLEVLDASIGYGRHPVSEHLDVAIPDRSFTVIIGPNACGKSTLLRAVSRLLRPTAGKVVLDGRSIAEYGSREVARRSGCCRSPRWRPTGSPWPT